MITQERLKEVLSYDPDTGVFTWLDSGKVAGLPHTKGYLRMSLDGGKYLMHRLAWLYVHGKFPDNQIDHINHGKKDNRICNLRDVTGSQNQMNRGVQSNSTTGIKGVYWIKNRNKYRAQIKVMGKITYLGYFVDKMEAARAYMLACKELHGDFAHG